jgi:signal recognition particle GTPase
MFKRQVAIIQSMTKAERAKPDLLKPAARSASPPVPASRPPINKLLKMHRQMADMMKKMGKGKGMLGKLMGGMGGGRSSGCGNSPADANLDPDFAEKFLNFIVHEVIRHHEAIAAEAGN